MIEEDKHWLSPNKAASLSENSGWASLFFSGLSYGIPALLNYLGLMGAEIFGTVTGGISAGLAVIGALFTLSSKDLLKKLKNEIIKRGTIPTKITLLTGYSTEDNDKKAENIEKLGNSLKNNEWRIR